MSSWRRVKHRPLKKYTFDWYMHMAGLAFVRGDFTKQKEYEDKACLCRNAINKKRFAEFEKWRVEEW